MYALCYYISSETYSTDYGLNKNFVVISVFKGKMTKAIILFVG